MVANSRSLYLSLASNHGVTVDRLWYTVSWVTSAADISTREFSAELFIPGYY